MTITTKWPRLLVAGDPVTADQAAEIIARTTHWPPYINDKAWQQLILSELHRIGHPVEPHRGGEMDAFGNYWRAVDAWRRDRGILNLSYLHNSRVGSSWIYGPHGWVDWDGTIGAGGWNVGKWPSDEEVTEDWTSIAAAFPYLRLTAQLVENEGEGGLAGQWTIANGEVVHDPTPVDFIKPVPAFGDGGGYLFAGLTPGGERGCTVEQLQHALNFLVADAPAGGAR